MADSKQQFSYRIGDYVEIVYYGIGTFVEIRNLHNGEYLWCDPWITDQYPIAKTNPAVQNIEGFLSAHQAYTKLKGIIVSHSHGDHFADVPEIMAQLCHTNKTPPLIFGDSNVQSLVCQYFAVNEYYQQHYSFYETFISKDFTNRELTRYGDADNRTNRQNFGLVFNIDKQSKPYFNAPILARETDPNYFYLLVYPMRFRHSEVPEVILGPPYDLASSPPLRSQYCEDETNTTCSFNNLYGFVFDVCGLKNGTPEKRASFCFIPGSCPLADEDWKKLYSKAMDSEEKPPFNFFFHVPSAAEFIAGKMTDPEGKKRSLTVNSADYSVFHTADGDR